MAQREGCRLDVYPDIYGKATVGLGHLVQPSDNLRMGQVISYDRAIELFLSDYKRLKIDYCINRASWWQTPQKLAIGSFIWAHGYGDWIGGGTEALLMNPKVTQEQIQLRLKQNWDLKKPKNQARNAADFRLFHPLKHSTGIIYYASLLNGSNFYYSPDLNEAFFSFATMLNAIERAPHEKASKESGTNTEKGLNKNLAIGGILAISALFLLGR